MTVLREVVETGLPFPANDKLGEPKIAKPFQTKISIPDLLLTIDDLILVQDYCDFEACNTSDETKNKNDQEELKHV